VNIISETNITVCDSIMGSFKTTWAIDMMNTHKDRNYLYITPYLTEVDRIKENTEVNFFDPENRGTGKLQSLNRLLSYGNNIVSTHSLFKRITNETKDLIKKGKYILILDEVLDVVGEYKDLKKGDIKFLLKENLISIDPDTGYILWNEKKEYDDYKYEEVMHLAKNKCLVRVNSTTTLWHFQPSIFSLFDEVYVLTYLFRGSIMKSYFEYHKINYNMKQVKNINGKLFLDNYCPEEENREKYNKLINICEDNKLNTIGEKSNALSKNWLKKAGTIGYKKIKDNLYDYFTNKTNKTNKNEPPAKANTIMWTCFKNDESKLQGRGYTRAIPKSGIPLNPSREDKQKAKCFVSLNCRGTNIYANRFNLAYTINRYISPYIRKYFANNGVVFDEDAFSLSELLQWIWRSRIRNNQPINIYIPSSRMRNLLNDWLEKNI